MLLYVWIEKIYQIPLETGITFMKRFQIEYMPSEHILVIEENNKFLQHFFGKNIEDVTALVGENGAGKTLFSKSLIKILQKPSAEESIILVTMTGLTIHVQCYGNPVHTIKFGQESFSFQNKEKKSIGGYTVMMETGDSVCQVGLFMVTNAFAPAELNDALYFNAEWYRSPIYSMQNVNQWEQERYGIQVGSFLHNNASVFAKAKSNSPLEEYRVYQNRLTIANYLDGKDIPIFQEMKLYQSFYMGIRPFEGHIPMENADQRLKDECGQIKKMFQELERRKRGIMESALIMIMEEACLYFIEIRDMINDKIEEWINSDNCIIDTQFLKLLLKRMNEIYSDRKDKNMMSSDRWEWLNQAEKLFEQLEKWKEDPAKKDLFDYQKGEYGFGNEAGERLLNFYMEKIQNKDNFWIRAIGFNVRGGSSGEMAAINLFAYISELMNLLSEELKKNTIFIIIDEIDIGLHPKWQQRILQYLVDFLGQRFPEQHFQLLITSHSPIFLSDIPADRVYCISRNVDGVDKIQIEACRNATFGANIYNLFYDGFFMDRGTIGTFAQDKIDTVISYLQGGSEKKISQEEVDCIIEYIGEPVVRDRLRMMNRKNSLQF